MNLASSAVFINAVIDVRVEQGMFHFTLGETIPTKDQKTDFIPAFRATIPEGDAAKLFGFLSDKTNDSQEMLVEENVTKQNLQSTKLENAGTTTPLKNRRHIPFGDGKPHGS